MVHVTPRAREYLLRLRRAADPSRPPAALRLVVASPGSLALLPGDRNPDDRLVTHRGALLLLLDETTASALDRATVDVRDGGAGPGLVVRPPRRRRRPPAVGCVDPSGGVQMRQSPMSGAGAGR